jgi:regulation of enolase protein 1 (concanavalin A-like superfamily)
VQFSGTSWLNPSSNQGWADQQTGGYIQGNWNRPSDAFTSCSQGCSLFEATRPVWLQMPAAVQVSAANHVTFSTDTFTDLGQMGLGIGEDADATTSGVGLGASDITVTGSRFTQIAAGGIMVGGYRADAHHPSDTRMTNQNITIKDNLIHDVAIDYRDNDAILATYTTNAAISHNEVYNLPYSGISIGYGWGVNDPGGSPDYQNRGIYNYQPIYNTPTTATGNSVVGNYVHNFMQSMNDGGCVYTLSANPSSVINQNYCTAGANQGIYFDEGSRFLSASNNVFNGVGPYTHQNATSINNTGNFTLTDNWATADGNVTNGNRGSVVSGTVIVTNGVWPSGAQTVMNAAGLEPAYQYLNNPVTAPYSTFAVTSPTNYSESNGQFTITGTGADVWSGGTQHDDQYGSIYQSQSFTSGTTVNVKVNQLDNTNPWAKAGIMVRNSIAGAGSSAGYAVLAVTPSNGVVLEWDSNGDGYVDSEEKIVGIKAPVWLRLTRTGNQATGYYSTDGSTFTPVGPAVTMTGANTTEDVGVFHTSHDNNVAGTATFSGLGITTSPFTGYANIPANLDQHQGQFTITGTGADVWGAGGQHDDQYGAVYQAAAASSTAVVTVHVDSQSNPNSWAKAGIMLRNSIAGAGSSAGYAVVAVTPGNGVVLEWDSNGDGYLDSEAKTAAITAPVWLRLTRSGTSVTAYYSADGTNWNQIGTATLSSSSGTEDVGMFSLSHDNSTAGTATFSQFSIS